MQVRIWGCRGSIPVAQTSDSIRQKVGYAVTAAVAEGLNDRDRIESFLDRLPFFVIGTHGGDTSCVEIASSVDTDLILDCGSGLRSLGLDRIRTHGPKVPRTYDVVMSHFHWDHVQGFPFFIPAFIPGNRIRIHGCHELDVMREALRRQQAAPWFPVDFSDLGADIEFHRIRPGEPLSLGGCTITPMKQVHAGDSYGYRVEQDGKVLVYATDSEHKPEDLEYRTQVEAFFKDADAVIFDAMYSLADAITVKRDWGHSSNMMGVDLCLSAGVKRLVMFHHDPIHGDERLSHVLHRTRSIEKITRRGRGPLVVDNAYDGMVLEL